MLRYEALGEVTRKLASDTLAQKLAAAGNGKAPTRSRVTFRTLAGEWDASVLPMYKHSTQKHRRFMLKKHLLPRFGDRALSDVTRQEIQAYVAHLTQAGYAPKSIDHIHDVLSAVLRTAVKWGHLQENPARGVDLPTLRCVRPKWALTTSQAALAAGGVAAAPTDDGRVGDPLGPSTRRAVRAALEGHRRAGAAAHGARGRVRRRLRTPKTEAGARQIPLSDTALTLIAEWKAHVENAEPDALVFSTRLGTPISPNNVLRRFIFPACKRLGLPRATWLTFRRTYSSWSHDKGVPGKVVAQLMGHANVDTTLNVYTQVLDGSLREAVEKVGGELFTIVHKPEQEDSADRGVSLIERIGAPCTTRTCDLLVRSQTLYPAELRALEDETLRAPVGHPPKHAQTLTISLRAQPSERLADGRDSRPRTAYEGLHAAPDRPGFLDGRVSGRDGEEILAAGHGQGRALPDQLRAREPGQGQRDLRRGPVHGVLRSGSLKTVRLEAGHYVRGRPGDSSSGRLPSAVSGSVASAFSSTMISIALRLSSFSMS